MPETIRKAEKSKIFFEIRANTGTKESIPKVMYEMCGRGCCNLLVGTGISFGVSYLKSRPVSVTPESTPEAVVESSTPVSSEAVSSEGSIPVSTPASSESASVPVVPAKTKEEVIQMMLASEGTWCQGNYVTPEGIPLANNGIGFVDLDQDGTPEFIHGYAVEPLVGVPVGYWKRYDVYSLKTSQLEYIGSIKTLDIKQNTQTGQIVFFNNGYVEGKNENNVFSSCLEGEASSFVNGKIEIRNFLNKGQAERQLRHKKRFSILFMKMDCQKK